MSSLEDDTVIEPNTKRVKQENEDRLGGLPDCVLLHLLSFLNAKDVVRTCVLSKRWKHLWKRVPALLLDCSYFSPIKRFDKFVRRIMSLRDESIALHTLDYNRNIPLHTLDFNLDYNRNLRSRPPPLRTLANYIFSNRTQLQQLKISIFGDCSLILRCISSSQTLTSLKLTIYRKEWRRYLKTLFPRSLSLPALTTLYLYNFAFCASDDASYADPFSAFNSLNSLTIRNFTVSDAQILSISSATLVNLTMQDSSSDFTKIELSALNLSTFTFDGIPHQKLCGNTLSSVTQLDIDADPDFPFGESPSILLSWLLDLPNIKSLTVTSNTLLVLSLVPDLLNVKIPSLCNLKSLKLKLKHLSIEAPIYLETVLLENKSCKEAAMIKEAFKAGLEPAATIPDKIVGFLLQNSPSAEVGMIDHWHSRKRTLHYEKVMPVRKATCGRRYNYK